MTTQEDTTASATTTTATREGLPEGSDSRIMSTFRLIRDHYGMYQDLFAQHGDPVRVNSFNGDVYATKNPEWIRQIFSNSPADYEPFAVDTLAPLIGPGSVLLLRGEEHKTQRKLLMPPFHGERMKAYGEVMRQVAQAQLERVRPGESFITQDMTTQTSLEVIVRAVFGVTGEERVAQSVALIEETMAAMHPLLLFVKQLQRPILGGGPWVRFQEALARTEAMLYEEIATKRAEGPAEDILSMLLEARYESGEPLTEQEIRDHLFTLLLAGHETTGVTLCWAMYHIHSHPQVLERLREEVSEALAQGASADDLSKLPYVTAVCQETLRIYPIVPDVLRLLNAPMNLGGFEIPAGKAVAVAISAVHHDPELYAEPAQFRPERFLERKYKPWEFMPYGGGHRRCIGAAFANYELAIVLATWIAEGRFELLDHDVKPRRRNVSIAPEGGVKMKRIA